MRRGVLCCLLLALLLGLSLPAVCEEDDDMSILELTEDDTLVLLEEDEEDPNGVPNIYEADGSVLITISATGDLTIGGDSRKRTDIFNDELKKQGGDISFTMRNVRDIFMADDLTIVNFEGTLTDSTYVPSNKKNNEFLFSAPPSYVSMLSDNGIEAVALENNHVMDHGESAYEDTKYALKNAGIVYSNSTETGVIEIKGVKIAMLSYLCIDRWDSLRTQVPKDIEAAKKEYDLVICSFHWGYELAYSPTQNQVDMGHLAVDSGADLVLGHHSHRINPIEKYNGVYICYSLGNFCFSGNSKPSDMTSYIFQTRFRVKPDGITIQNEGFRIIPIRISSLTNRNDFIPTPLDKDTAIDSLLTTLTANSHVIRKSGSTFKKTGQTLEYAVVDYPLTWAGE